MTILGGVLKYYEGINVLSSLCHNILFGLMFTQPGSSAIIVETYQHMIICGHIMKLERRANSNLDGKLCTSDSFGDLGLSNRYI